MKKIIMIISVLAMTAMLSGCIGTAFRNGVNEVIEKNEVVEKSDDVEKKNADSAFNDARDALSIYIAENSWGDGTEVVGEGSVFEVEIGGKYWYFTYDNNGLTRNEHFNTKPALPDSYETITNDDVPSIPSNVTVYLVKPDSVRAFTDVKNALSIYIAEMADGSGEEVVGEGSVFEVEIGGKYWYFTYADNGLTRNEHFNTKPTLPDSYETITNDDVPNIPSNVTIYLVVPD